MGPDEFDVEEWIAQGDHSAEGTSSLRVEELRKIGEAQGLTELGKLRKQELVAAIRGKLGESEDPETGSRPSSGASGAGSAGPSSGADNAHISLELRKLEMEHEFRMRKLEMELELRRTEHTSMGSEHEFNFSRTVKMLPKFREGEADCFFVTFESVLGKMKCPREMWTLLLQSVVEGRAQEVLSAIGPEESFESAKEAILAAYQLVPEAYRQKFRNLKKAQNQTFVEFSREKERVFDRWYRSLQAEKSFAALREVILLEEYKRSIPLTIRQHLEDNRVTDLAQAAVFSDDYQLTHPFRDFPKHQGTGVILGKGPRGNHQSGRPNEGQQSIERAGRPVPNRIVCFYCNHPGHRKSECQKKAADDAKRDPNKPTGFVSRKVHTCRTVQEELGASLEPVGEKNKPNLSVIEGFKPFTSKGVVSHQGVTKPVVILRDTGACQSLLLTGVLGDLQGTVPLDEMCLTGVGECVFSTPLHEVHLSSPLVSGQVRVGLVPSLPFEGVGLLLGNDLAGDKVCAPPILVEKPVTDPDTEALAKEFPGIFPACAVTRSQVRNSPLGPPEGRGEQLVASGARKSEPEKSGSTVDSSPFGLQESGQNGRQEAMPELTFTRQALIEAQSGAADLKGLWSDALNVSESESVPECFFIEAGVLFRKWRPRHVPADETWTSVQQIVVPPCYRDEILRLAHDIPVAGHLGVRKTQARVMAHFYWPKMHRDVAEYCRTCHTCQIVGKPQHSPRPAPLIPIPTQEEPFTRVLVDCVGPLPKTRSGNSFLLTIMDTSTRFPEAIPLRKITARVVTEALLTFFTRYGLPREIQSDQGTNFMSKLFRDVMSQLGLKQIRSTPYHPQSQGALERYHQTLKTMLKAYCQDYPNDWDKGVSFVLFATRDSPQDSTGFSPFELVYGHEVRGPLKVVKERFLDPNPQPDELSYVAQFKDRLATACSVANEHLAKSQNTMKHRFDKRAKARSFQAGDKVLLLLPVLGNSLSTRFQGPYVVEEKLSDVNYVVRTPERRKKRRVCHINLLKRYHHRVEAPPIVCKPTGAVDLAQAHMNESSSDMELKGGAKHDIVALPLNNSGVLATLRSDLGHLSSVQKEDLLGIIGEFGQVFKDQPGRTNVAVHDMNVGDAKPVRQRPYRLNPEKLARVRKEVNYMLEQGLAEPSQSEWSSPVVLVPKADGGDRLCIDYRRVNALTVADSFPIPRIEDCIDRVGRSQFVSKIDLLKGYWQVPLTQHASEISAFVTPDGLYQCTAMPFGMRNSPATFQRMMNYVTRSCTNCTVYLDDVLVFSDTWEAHISHLEQLFTCLADANLVVNLGKSEFAKATVVYLGHVIGQGRVVPRMAKVQAIADFPAPTTKKGVLRFLGMTGFYRRFCPNYSSVAVPLTNLLKTKTKFEWTTFCEQAFQNLKALLVSEPVLTVPDFTKPFKLAVDASDVGVGAVLLQADGAGVDRPLGYFSRKLSSAQKKYSTIEKELLGLVLAIQHFEIYVSSSQDGVVVYTDHNPLVFLERFKTTSNRLFRWSLLLQPYSLKVVHIAGRDNLIADALSRQ